MGNKLITFNALTGIFESDTPDDNFKVAADFLLEAVTDWPTKDLLEPGELISELRNDISQELTFDNLNKYLNSLSPNQDPWKIESLTALIELFDFNRNQNYNKSVDLEDVVRQISEHYSKKSNS